MTAPDQRRTAPAAQRNLEPLLQALARHAPSSGRSLEIASGSGQHIVHFAAAHPGLVWQPSDRDSGNIGSILAWAAHTPAPNLLSPIVLDAALAGWGAEQAGLSLILFVNLLHLITTDEARIVLQECAAALAPGGRLIAYGPFLRDGKTTSPGDADFDAALRARDPAIGYKDIVWVTALCNRLGLIVLTEDMPANNLLLVAQKT